MVRGISSIFLTPADMTLTGVLPNYLRSALTSIVYEKSLWTPPRPPVTKISIPANALHIIVPATVVEPNPFCAKTYGKSLLLTFRDLLPFFANYSILF